MKKAFLILIFLAIPSVLVHAQTTTVAPTPLNAGFFSDIWYSSTRPYEGDALKVFGGLYNSSAVNVSGTAVYYVDGKEIGKTAFVSAPNSLTQVSISWTAVGGDHKIRIKAETTQTLAQAESGEDTLTVTKRPVKADIQKDVQNVIQKTTAAIDPVAEKLADNITNLGDSLGATAQKKVADVIGNDKKFASVASASASVNPLIQGFFDGTAYLVRHWAWSLLGLVVLYFIYRATHKKESWW